MIRKFYILLFLTFSFTAKSQNLIQNSSFDDYSTYLDKNNNIVYQPNFWYYNSKLLNHPIYYSTDRFLNKDILYNFHPDAELIEQGQKLNYISILLLPNTQKAYSILKKPLKKGHRYHLQLNVKAYKQSNCLSDILIGFKDTIDFENESCNYSVQLSYKDSLSNDYLFNNWTTISSEFTALGDEKVIVLGAGSTEDYLNIIKANRSKFYQSYDGGPFSIKFFIDNPILSEIVNENLIIQGIDTLNIGNSIVLNNIYFDFDKYTILEKSFPMLHKLIDYLKTNKNIRIQISGHTDNIGIKDYNHELSLKRAKAVVDYLISKNIEKERLQALGFGSLYPVESNETEFGRQLNRRIEIKIVDK